MPYSPSRCWLAIFLLTCTWALPASATTIETIAQSFTGNPIEVKVTLDDAGAGPGEILIGLEVLAGQEGDLRGIFLNLSDDSLLDGIEATGPCVTDVQKFDVVDLGQGANLLGGGSPCPCDLGIELGTPGIGKDDIQSTSFVLSHPDVTLPLSLFQGQRVGVRVTSVGNGDHREGSSKTVAIIPEPTTTGLLVLGLTMLSAGRRHLRRRA
jgi:hypothetical protein